MLRLALKRLSWLASLATVMSGASRAVNQSHGGSSKQARAVADGLEADVVAFNQTPDNHRLQPCERYLSTDLAAEARKEVEQ